MQITSGGNRFDWTRLKMQSADTDAEPGTAARAGGPDALPLATLLLGAAIAFAAWAYLTLFQGRISAEEASYLVKALWQATGQSNADIVPDSTGKMPLYLYQLGFWQTIDGLGVVFARTMSVGLGVINGLLLFALCKRLTANTIVAAAAVFICLATPATSAFFATATPAAMASALHLAALWLIVDSLGRQRPWASILLGALCAALYFYRQGMLLSVVVLVPLYVAAVGRQRPLQAGLVFAGFAAVTAILLVILPDRMAAYALRVPVISPFLDNIGALAPNFMLIDRGTLGPMTMGPAFARAAPAEILNDFLLPYSGTLILAGILLVLARGSLRILWIAPLYFLWLAAGYYLGSLGLCTGCMPSLTPYFGAVGALAAALGLAVLAQHARQKGAPSAPSVLIGATLAVGLNVFAPTLVAQNNAGTFPIALTPQGSTEAREVEALARWINMNVPAQEPVLLLHGMGRQSVAGLAYAAVLAEHPIPVQSIDPAATHRIVNPKLSAQVRESVQAAIEEENLWADATLNRWLDRDYDVVIFQEDRSIDQRAQIAALSARFSVAASIVYRGTTLFLYKRKTVQ